MKLLNSLKTGIAISALAIATLTASASAQASLTYNYTGNTLDSSSSLLNNKIITGVLNIHNAALETSLTDSVSNMITLAYGDRGVAGKYDFDFNIGGVFHITSLSSGNTSVDNSSYLFQIKTAANTGKITDWNIHLENNSAGCAGTDTKNCRIDLEYGEDEFAQYQLKVRGHFQTKTGTEDFECNDIYWTGPGGITHPAASPEALSMMLGGFALMGFAALRRK